MGWACFFFFGLAVAAVRVAVVQRAAAVRTLAQRLKKDLQPLLDDHSHNLPGQQHLLVHQRVGIVRLDAAGAEGV